MNDFAGQRELVAENLSVRVCLELTKYSQEMKQERKMVRSSPPIQVLQRAPAGTLASLIALLSVALPRRAAGPAAAGKRLQTAGECELAEVAVTVA